MLIIHMTAGELAEYLKTAIATQIEDAVNRGIKLKELEAQREKLVSINYMVREKSLGGRIMIKKLIEQGHIKQCEDGRIIYNTVLNYLDNVKKK